jgi:hypothetical protein
MTTLRNIVRNAYRESGIIQKGLQPDADQYAEGLQKLKNIIENVFEEEVGTRFQDLRYGSDGVDSRYSSYTSDIQSYLDTTYLPSAARLIVNKDSPSTVYLEPSPCDGSLISVRDAKGSFATAPFTLDAGPNLIEGAKTVSLDIDTLSATWMYRADLAEWTRLESLEEDSDMPFPSQFDDYFIIKTATALHPRYLVTAEQQTMMHYRDAQRRFRSRYSFDRQMPSERALRILGQNNRPDILSGFRNTTDLFNNGII